MQKRKYEVEVTGLPDGTQAVDVRAALAKAVLQLHTKESGGLVVGTSGGVV